MRSYNIGASWQIAPPTEVSVCEKDELYPTGKNQPLRGGDALGVV